MNLSTLVLPALICTIAISSTQEAKVRAQSLVKEALAFGKKEGKQALLREINNSSGRFHVSSGNDLYLFVFDMKGLALAHGFQAGLVNINRWDHKDASGKYFIREFVETVQANGSGWVDYQYANPKTGKVEPKTSYLDSMDGLIVGCGVYK